MDEKCEDGEYVVRDWRFGGSHEAMRILQTVDADNAEPHYENDVLSTKLLMAESKKAN